MHPEMKDNRNRKNLQYADVYFLYSMYCFIARASVQLQWAFLQIRQLQLGGTEGERSYDEMETIVWTMEM